MRAHLYQVITDEAGNVQPGTAVRLLTPDVAPGDAQPIDVDVWATKTGPDAIPTEFTADDGVIDVWFDEPGFVMLGLTVPGANEYFVDNVAAGSPGGGGSQVIISPEPPPEPVEGTLWCDSDAPSGEQTEVALFSYAGAPSTEVSPPYRPTFSGFLAKVRMTAGSAGTADSTIHLYVDGTEVAVETLLAGSATADVVYTGESLVAITDQQVLTCSVEAGAGLASLVLQVVISA